MHFPTLPKRWRLPAASEAKKPPKSNATRVTTPRKINPINNASKLSRSVSFNSDNVFKVPATPSSSSSSSTTTASTRLSRSMSGPRHYETAGEEAAAACPNCQYQSRQDWRSRSLMDLQRQQPQSASVPSSTTAAASRSSSLVRLNPSMQQTTTPRGCENQQKLSTSSNNIATIFSNNLRSNSWRNLSVIGQHTNTETGAAARGKHYLGKSIY